MRDPKHQMWAEACALLKQAEQLHRQFFEPSREAARAGSRPSMCSRPSGKLWIIAALPGVAPEAVRVEIEGPTLIIAGIRPLPCKGRNANIVRLEIPYGRFERRISPFASLAPRRARTLAMAVSCSLSPSCKSGSLVQKS